MSKMYDVIVVGGGHAGVEAAASAARMGCSVALMTLSKNKIALMPCNPAVGGIGKGHIVFEVSALGGVMPRACTESYIQANMLNKRKGPAVQGLRLQVDNQKYPKTVQEIISQHSGVTVIEAMADQIIKNGNSVVGISDTHGNQYLCKALILTTGTFLNGLIHQGLKNFEAGREDEKAVKGLAKSIMDLGLKMGRLKTGTPPRILRSSIDFALMEEQASHELDSLFEFEDHNVEHKTSCFITRTNPQAHKIILDNADKSPMFMGKMSGLAPRYCPSIEDKVSRFESKDSHQVFVEPESLSNELMYPNGISTSLPLDVQEKFIRCIKGFENAIIAKPGYAIEYDFVYPNQLYHTLEVKNYPGLYFAGQINGTTGYEEAAGQGIIAGINAASKILNKDPFILNRDESYIGVMIDDLVTLGVDEPYRMFTSRAERRLLLRQDNAFYRLYKKSYEYGLIKKAIYQAINREYISVSNKVHEVLSDKRKASHIAQLFSKGDDQSVKNTYINNYNFSSRAREYMYAEFLYAPYKVREEAEIKKAKEYKDLEIPSDFVYTDIPGLSSELQSKLNLYRPATIAQASLIKGMTPAALSLLIFNLRRCLKA